MGATIYFLFAVYSTGYGVAMTSTPIGTADQCQAAAAQLQTIEGWSSKLRTVCIRGEK